MSRHPDSVVTALSLLRADRAIGETLFQSSPPIIMAHSQTFDAQSSGRRRKCRCVSETSAIASQISKKDTVAFDSIVEVTERVIETWGLIGDCRVCTLDSTKRDGSFVQIYTDIAAKLITLFEAAIHAYPDEAEGGTAHYFRLIFPFQLTLGLLH